MYVVQVFNMYVINKSCVEEIFLKLIYTVPALSLKKKKYQTQKTQKDTSWEGFNVIAPWICNIYYFENQPTWARKKTKH